VNRRLILVGVLAAVALALATFPMRLALALGGSAAAGLSARDVSGSIWSGQLADARWRGAALGTINAGLSPGALLGGDLRIDFARDDALNGRLGGAMLLNGGGGVEDVTGALSLGTSLAGIPLDRLQLDGVGARFGRSGRCTEAAGTMQLRLALPVPGLDLTNGLSGPLRCKDGRAEAMLASQSGMERLQLGFDGKGAWRAQLSVAAGRDPLLANLLRSAGFQAVGDMMVLVQQGRM
jgi:general secretion pathway protein N